MEPEAPTWIGRVREAAVGALRPERPLPDTQPVYVASWIYVFGVLSLAAFAVVLLSGAVIALAGPSWWHTSSVGHFVNSLHLWSTELFFFFMVVHLWGKVLHGCVAGAPGADVDHGRALVPRLDRGRVHRLPVAAELRRAMDRRSGEGRLNASGIGSFFNVLNFGQMLLWHVLLLPLAIAFLIGIQVMLVRRRGVVPPLPAAAEDVEDT